MGCQSFQPYESPFEISIWNQDWRVGSSYTVEIFSTKLSYRDQNLLFENQDLGFDILNEYYDKGFVYITHKANNTVVKTSDRNTRGALMLFKYVLRLAETIQLK